MDYIMPLLSKRSFLQSLFVAPAIVAATNIMPVKAVSLFTQPAPDKLIVPTMDFIFPTDRTKQTLITDLETINEAVAGSVWKLYEFESGERRWMTQYSASVFKFNGMPVKTMEVPPTHQEIDTTVALMKADPGSAVIWGIPSHLRR